MKIFLIGMPGSGKTTIGRQLARELKFPFVDLDKEIESDQRKTIPEIFTEEGEDHFRLVESRLMKDFASRAESFVMATGGGAPCFFNGIEVLNASGVTVFLDTSLDTIKQRLEKSTNRPLLVDERSRQDNLQKLHEHRRKFYSQARVQIKEPTLEKVLNALKPR